MSHAIWQRIWEIKVMLTCYQQYTHFYVSKYTHMDDLLPKIHCSDRHLVPSGFLPLYSPMQMLAWRTPRHTAPPHSWISSVRLAQGGCESDEMNMSGWSRNRSCWCSPAERCCCSRQIWRQQQREKLLLAVTPKKNNCTLCGVRMNKQIVAWPRPSASLSSKIKKTLNL